MSPCSWCATGTSICLREIDQFIAHAVNGHDTAWVLRVNLNLGAQVRHVAVQRPVEHLPAVARDQFDQMVAREHLARMIEEYPEQAVFRRRHFDLLAAPRDFVAVRSIVISPTLHTSCCAFRGGSIPAGARSRRRRMVFTRATTSRGL